MLNDGVGYGGQSPGVEARTQEALGMFGRLPKFEQCLSHYLMLDKSLTSAHSLFLFIPYYSVRRRIIEKAFISYDEDHMA